MPSPSPSPSPGELQPVLFCEIATDRTAIKEAIDDQGTLEENTRSFRLVYEDTVEDLRIPLNYSGLPQIGDVHPTNSSIQVRRVAPMLIKDGHRHFVMTVDYDTPPIGGYKENPADTPWVVATDVREGQVILDNDLTDNGLGLKFLKIQNSAFEPFQDPMIETEFYYVLNMTKNLNEYTIADSLAIQNTINDADVTIAGHLFERHCLWCTRYTTTGKQTQGKSNFYPLNVQFIYKPPFKINGPASFVMRDPTGDIYKDEVVFVDEGDEIIVPGWDRAVIDQGYNHRPNNKEGINGIGKRYTELVPIIDCAQKQSKNPRLLDGKGRSWRCLDENEVPSTYNEVYLIFQTKRDFDFESVDPAFPVDFP